MPCIQFIGSYSSLIRISVCYDQMASDLGGTLVRLLSLLGVQGFISSHRSFSLLFCDVPPLCGRSGSSSCPKPWSAGVGAAWFGEYLWYYVMYMYHSPFNGIDSFFIAHIAV